VDSDPSLQAAWLAAECGLLPVQGTARIVFIIPYRPWQARVNAAKRESGNMYDAKSLTLLEVA
jgi:hypothetical protein